MLNAHQELGGFSRLQADVQGVQSLLYLPLGVDVQGAGFLRCLFAATAVQVHIVKLQEVGRQPEIPALIAGVVQSEPEPVSACSGAE